MSDDLLGDDGHLKKGMFRGIKARRKKSKRKEAELRKQAAEQLAQTISMWDEMRATRDPHMDAQAVQTQRDAMGQMGQIAQQGYTNVDRQAFSAAQQQADQNAASQRASSLQQAAARGQRGGGLAMMQAAAANQGAANQGAQTAAQIATQGRDRSMAATQAQFGMANGLGEQLNAFNQQNFQNRLGVTEGATNAYGNAAAFNQSGADAERARRNQAIQMIMNPMQKAGEYFASAYGGGNNNSGSSSSSSSSGGGKK